MNCRACERLLDAWVDDELTGRESLLVRSHLADCRECRAEVERLRELKSMIGARFAAVNGREPVAPSFERMAARATAAEPSRRWEPPVWFYGAVAASAALTTFVFLPRSAPERPLRPAEIVRSTPAPMTWQIGLDQTMTAAPDPTAGAPVFSATYVGR